jgi:hypothetical protein
VLFVEREVQVRLVWLVSIPNEGDTIWTRYETLPELSVEGFQAKVTLVGVMAVVCRLVGCVGALRSLPAWTGAGPRSNEIASTAAAATGINLSLDRLFIFCSLRETGK